MEREELLKYCKYYHGEEEEPSFDDQNKIMLWFYEKCWCIGYERNGEGNFQNEISEYKAYVDNVRQIDDDRPISLKALLFNRYAKTEYSAADAAVGFLKFYHTYYD